MEQGEQKGRWFSRIGSMVNISCWRRSSIRCRRNRIVCSMARLGCYVVKGNFAFSVLIYTGVKIS